jgi:hypothetical protein
MSASFAFAVAINVDKSLLQTVCTCILSSRAARLRQTFAFISLGSPIFSYGSHTYICRVSMNPLFLLVVAIIDA